MRNLGSSVNEVLRRNVHWVLLAVAAVALYSTVANHVENGSTRGRVSRDEERTHRIAVAAQRVGCASAEQTVGASRIRQVGANGVVESVRHWRGRLLRQRHTLLVAKNGGRCERVLGLPPFDEQADGALRQIDKLLERTGGIPTRSHPQALPLPASSRPRTADRATGPTVAVPAAPAAHRPSSASPPRPAPAPGHRHRTPRSPSSPPSGDPAPSPSNLGGSASNAAGSSSSSHSERTTEVVHESSSPSSESPTASAPEHPAPVVEGVGSAVEEVGHVVGETGQTVNEGAKGVTCAVGLAC